MTGRGWGRTIPDIVPLSVFSPRIMNTPQAGERPPSGMLSGYTQTYLIWKTANGAEASMVDGDGKEAEDQTEHEVLFRCGNWCYTGHVVLRNELGLEDMPVAIPLLQRQQSRLHYYCNAGAIPQQSNFHEPIKLVYAASDFAAQCFSSGVVTSVVPRSILQSSPAPPFSIRPWASERRTTETPRFLAEGTTNKP